MQIGVLGRGKVSFLVEDILSASAQLNYYDDFAPELKNIFEATEEQLVIAIGIIELRRKLFAHYHDRKLMTLVSPQAVTSARAKLGKGVIISHWCTLHANAELGEGCFLYTGSIVDCSAKVGSFGVIGPQVYIGNRVQIGENCRIDSGVHIIPDTIIGNNVTIAAGSLVTRSIGDNETVAGSPARTLRGDYAKRI